MDTQQAYEMMRVYLTRPGALRAVGDKGNCMYETRVNGELHRCAIGCILPLSALDSTAVVEEVSGDEPQAGAMVELRDFQGGILSLFEQNFDLSSLDNVDLGFLEVAQGIHDKGSSWVLNKFNVALLDAAAADYGLKVVNDDAPVGAPREELTPVG